MRRLIYLVKGLSALSTTAALVAGVPVVLYQAVGWPVDNLVGAITDDLMSDNQRVQTILRYGLACVAWLAWSQIAWALLVEAWAVLRGRAAGRAGFMPGLQPMAFRLVATTTLVVAALTPDPARARDLPPLTAPVAADHDEAVSAWLSTDETHLIVDREGDVAMVADTQNDRPTYVVAAGDTFWSLAERWFGDGLRWRELRSFNTGHTEADGTTISEATEELRPGWTLLLPPDAVLPLAAQTGAIDTVVVGEGDHFWAIAEQSLAERLGRAPTVEEVTPFWADLVEQNRDRLLPPEDPDVIYPGQQFTVPPDPAAASDVADDDADAGIDDDSEADSGAEADGSGEAETPAPPASDPTTPPPSTSPTTTPAPPPFTSPTTTPAPPPSSSSSVPTPFEVPTTDLEPSATLPPPPNVQGDATSTLPPPPTEAGSHLPPPPEPEGEDTSTTMPGLQSIPAEGSEQAAVGEPPAPGPASASAGAAGGGGRSAAGGGGSDGLATAPAENIDNTGNETGDVPLPAVALAAVSGLGLLAAGVWRVVDRRRDQSLGARRPGSAPMFQPPPGGLRLLARHSDDQALADVDEALRVLAAGISGSVAVPDLVGVVVESETITLLLDTPHGSPPAPFTIDEDGRVWRLDRSAPLGDVARWTEAPFPALATVGHTEQSHLLLNLEHAGILNVSGVSVSEIIDTMATMALELATSPIADTLEVLCVGFGEELGGLERVTAVADLAEAEARIRAHAATVASLVAEVEVNGPGGRSAGIGGDTWTPLVVFDAASTADQAGWLLDAAAMTADGGVVAVVSASDQSHWSMRVTPGEVQIPYLGISRRRRNLDLAERRDLVATIADAAQPTVVETADLVADITAHRVDSDPYTGTNGGPNGFDENETTSGAVARRAVPDWDANVVIRVLGPLSVERRDGQPITFARGATAEFIAYLAHHRRGVTIDATMEALWPSADAKRSWINNLSSDARRGLGATHDGRLLLPRMTGDGLFHLADEVGTDLERVVELMTHARGLSPVAAVEVLQQALELVAGPPYDSMSASWALFEGAVTHAIVVVDEAARTLATLALEEFNDVVTAEWATRQGLLANPRSNELHLLRLRAVLAQRGNGAAVESAFQQYRTIVLGDDDAPEGGSELDARIVDLYSSFRRSRPASWAGAGEPG